LFELVAGLDSACTTLSSSLKFNEFNQGDEGAVCANRFLPRLAAINSSREQFRQQLRLSNPAQSSQRQSRWSE